MVVYLKGVLTMKLVKLWVCSKKLLAVMDFSFIVSKPLPAVRLITTDGHSSLYNLDTIHIAAKEGVIMFICFS